MERRDALKCIVLGVGGAAAAPVRLAAAVPQPIPAPQVRALPPMLTARAAHTATALLDGRVLVAGGFAAGEGTVAGHEIFTPEPARWMRLAGGTPRQSHTATRLADGRVLLAGGYVAGGAVTDGCEIFDPRTNTFSAAGRLTVPRAGHEAVLLDGGRVLVIGGVSTNWQFLASAEILVAGAGGTPTGAMAVARESHAAIRLDPGRVLVAGGHHGRGAGAVILDAMELYDVAAGRFTPFGRLSVRRHKHDAVLLDDGRVLVTGGADERDDRGVYATTEVIEPRQGRSQAGPALGRGRYKHRGTAVVMGSQRVLLAGGAAQPEILDLARGIAATVDGAVSVAGQFAAMAPLGPARVLLTGGYGGTTGPRADAWLIDA